VVGRNASKINGIRNPFGPYQHQPRRGRTLERQDTSVKLWRDEFVMLSIRGEKQFIHDRGEHSTHSTTILMEFICSAFFFHHCYGLIERPGCNHQESVDLFGGL
jgi:hypothetical protein